MILGRFPCAFVVAMLLAGGVRADFEDDYEVKKWEEVAVQLPASPKESSLQPFYVSATTDNRFWVDLDSVSVGSDGVVRYTLVVRTGTGAKNVSYEGMRCETRERRLYAFGRSGRLLGEIPGGAMGAHSGGGEQPAACSPVYRILLPWGRCCVQRD